MFALAQAWGARIARALMTYWQHVDFASFTKDFGCLFSVCSSRKTHLLSARLKKAGVRLNKIMWLSKLERRARRLVQGGAYAKALWGVQALGMPPVYWRSYALRLLGPVAITPLAAAPPLPFGSHLVKTQQCSWCNICCLLSLICCLNFGVG